MKTVYAIGFDREGNLMLQGARGGAIRTAPCPFATNFKPCGKWCVHCGTIMFNENFFVLDLTCGAGARLVAVQEVQA